MKLTNNDLHIIFFLGSSNVTTEVFLYNFIGLFVLVCIGLLLFCCIKRNMTNIKLETNVKKGEQLVLASPITSDQNIQINISENDSEYEEIDESQMHHLSFHTRKQPESVNKRLLECLDQQNQNRDDYLTPYQPLVPTKCKQKAPISSIGSKYSQLQKQTREIVKNNASLSESHQYIDVIDDISYNVNTLDVRRCNSLKEQSLAIEGFLKRHSF